MGASDFELIDLYAIVDGPSGDSEAQALRTLAENLAGQRKWRVSPPRLIDRVQDGIRECGLALSLHAAYSRAGAKLPRELDRDHFNETVTLLNAIAAVSRELSIEFVVELNNVQTGWISEGLLDESLRIGLLNEWSQAVHGG